MTDAARRAGIDESTAPTRPQHETPFRGGHFDTSVHTFPIHFSAHRLRTGWIPLGDAPDGPAVAVVAVEPGNAFDGRAHHHETDQVRVFVEGSVQIGRTQYRPGDVRIQQAGRIYGPEHFGPDGSIELIFFANRQGMLPKYRDGGAAALATALEASGITLL